MRHGLSLTWGELLGTFSALAVGAMWTVPNFLSLFRILLVPVLVYLLTFTDAKSGALAAFLFIIAALTDYLDGYLARRNQSVSDFGKLLDPLADKLMIVAVLIMLAAMDRPGGESVPPWLVVLIVARETAVTIIRGIAMTEGIVMEAETLGKYKFILQTFAIVGLMIHYTYLDINFYAAGMYFLVISAFLALWSGINYHIKFLRLLRSQTRT